MTLKDTDCREVEAEILELFQEIRKVASPGRNSLEDAIGRAIAEGKRFKLWQESRLPLRNVRLFRNLNDELLPAGKFRLVRFPVLRWFRRKIKAKVVNASRLEVWSCDEHNRPDFPLSRIGLPDVPDTGPLTIEESLRDDLSLNLEIRRNERGLFINMKLTDPVSKNFSPGETVKKLSRLFGEAVGNWQKMIKFGVMEAALPVLMIVLSLVLIPAAMRSLSDAGQPGDDNYSRSNAGPDENQILGQKCFKQMCGDPKYLSDTDTVNGA